MMRLWDYAKTVYAFEEVKTNLLALQDRYHIDINACLWCLWCARYGYSFTAEEVTGILGQTAGMALHTTRPLRAIRSYLSSPKYGFADEDREALRGEVLRLELITEEMILRRLDEVTSKAGSPNESLDDMPARSEQLFTIAREAVDTPIMIADEDGPDSPLEHFRAIRRIAEEQGP